MHRSGSSMVARILEKLGVYLGEEQDFIEKQVDNPDGYWENRAFIYINERLLHVFGIAWDFVPQLPTTWQQLPKLDPLLYNDAINLIDRFKHHHYWGWKDPRNSLTLPFWQGLLPELKIIVCVRSPIDVHRSLWKRGYSSPTFSFNLWKTYYESITQSVIRTDTRSVLVCHYENFFTQPEVEVERISRFLAMDITDDQKQQASASINRWLKHHQNDNAELIRLAEQRCLQLYVDLSLAAGFVGIDELIQAVAPHDKAALTTAKSLLNFYRPQPEPKRSRLINVEHWSELKSFYPELAIDHVHIAALKASLTSAPASTSVLPRRPALTVAIPTYNANGYILDALHSILQQSFRDFELIVVDDSSTDNTISDLLQCTDERIRFFRNKAKLGIAKNWNECIRLAQGEFITIFHQDDVMMAGNLEKKVSFLRKNPSVGLVYSNVQIIDEHNNVTHDGWWFETPNAEQSIFKGNDYFGYMLWGDNLICCPSVMMRTACYQQIGLYDDRLPFTLDWEMWMRAALHFDIGYIDDMLIQYRIHANNETNNFQGFKNLFHCWRSKHLILDKFSKEIVDFADLSHKINDLYQQKAVAMFLQQIKSYNYFEASECLNFAYQLAQDNGQDSVIRLNDDIDFLFTHSGIASLDKSSPLKSHIIKKILNAIKIKM